MNLHRQIYRLTFTGYISAISNRVLPLPEHKPLDSLNRQEWIEVFINRATNEDYMPSSRRTGITHLKVLHEFLHSQSMAPVINYDNYAFRVSKDIAQCDVIFPHEVDKILDGIEGSDNHWLAIMLAFYCGLRCEELLI